MTIDATHSSQLFDAGLAMLVYSPFNDALTFTLPSGKTKTVTKECLDALCPQEAKLNGVSVVVYRASEITALPASRYVS